jgi:hypothetical protein
MEKRLLKIIRKKIGSEPSSLQILTALTDEVVSTLSGKERIWVETGLNVDGQYRTYREIIEYDPSNIYFYIDWGKLTIYYSMKNKNSVDFLAKTIYNKLKNKN